MSYDLYFTPRRKRNLVGRRKVFTSYQWQQYFSKRKNYQKDDNGRFQYNNEETGINFYFEPQSEEEQSDNILYFNLNYCRSHIFALEALIEINALVKAFNLHVDDYQALGMGKGPFVPEKFISGWENGNKSCYGAMKELNTSTTSLPVITKNTTRNVWNWNYNRFSENELGYQPKIMIFGKNDQCYTGSVIVPDDLVTLPKTQLWIYIDTSIENAVPEFIETKQFEELLSGHPIRTKFGCECYKFTREQVDETMQSARSLKRFKDQDLFQLQWHEVEEIDGDK